MNKLIEREENIKKNIEDSRRAIWNIENALKDITQRLASAEDEITENTDDIRTLDRDKVSNDDDIVTSDNFDEYFEKAMLDNLDTLICDKLRQIFENMLAEI